MKIAVISDIHDNIWNLQKALAMPELQATEEMLLCGYLCSPFVIHLLGRAYSRPVHLVFGNNDGDVKAIIRNSKKYSNIHIHGEYFRTLVGGHALAMNHYPDKAREIAENGGFDIVCYGHNHIVVNDEMVGDTLLINPGAIMGYNGGKLMDIPATYLILDTALPKAEVYQI
ncbi:YfcE family phosphodiesterase [Arenibacter sp. BSSL-BM3]|uniref:Phosphoesterase n=1 Tax=Arenibacter arenosicollis TaxID=2762274 RepID=A0ABR7QPF4_9FLAO|nr:YfcE family phosphodiesterase [Arenibacter arenosicollis]MBC8769048.1 YfcE family phosphodiesterase [Arenibacter arenosicollis]